MDNQSRSKMYFTFIFLEKDVRIYMMSNMWYIDLNNWMWELSLCFAILTVKQGINTVVDYKKKYYVSIVMHDIFESVLFEK